jgi:hypothetical protein
MDTLGINWLNLFMQVTVCMTVLLFIVLFTVFVRVKKISKFLTGIIGLLTVWITIFPLVFVTIWISIFVFNIITPSQSFEPAFLFYNSIVSLGEVTVLLTVLLMAFYIAHAKNSPLLLDGDRKYYQAGFLFLPFIIMPMYYLKFIKAKTTAIEKV